MKGFKLGLVILFGLAIASCSNNVKYSSDFDSGFDFSSLKNYRWSEPNSYNDKTKNYLNNDIIDKRIRENVNSGLQSSGFQLQASGDVSFLVNYTISTEDRADVNTYNTYSGFAPGWGCCFGGMGPYAYGGMGVGMGFSDSHTSVDHYQEGTLVLDILDPKSNKLVWRGTANGRVPKNLSQQEKEQAAQEVVGKILENFPPKEG